MANSTNYYGSSYTGAQVDQFLSEADRMFNSTWQGDPEGTVTVVKELTSANTFLWTVSAKSLAATIAQKYVPLSALGNAGGVATLDSSGKIPAAQLPGGTYPAIASYASLSAFPTTGDANTMYYAQNTSLYYRWSSASSSYVKIPAATTLGTTAGTAYEGSAGQANADAITAIKAGFSSPSTQKALLLLGCSGSAYVSVDSNNLTVHVHGTVTIDNPISGTSVSIVYYHPSGEQGFCNGIAMGQVINASASAVEVMPIQIAPGTTMDTFSFLGWNVGDTINFNFSYQLKQSSANTSSTATSGVNVHSLTLTGCTAASAAYISIDTANKVAKVYGTIIPSAANGGTVTMTYSGLGYQVAGAAVEFAQDTASGATDIELIPMQVVHTTTAGKDVITPCGWITSDTIVFNMTYNIEAYAG